LIALDLEATGIDPLTDRITQFGIVTHDGRSWSSLVNPEREITAEVVELTGITNEAAAKAPKFEFFADTLAELITDQPLVVYNGLRFDVPLLAEEFERANVHYKFGPVIDVDSLFKQHHSRTLTDAVRVYLGESHEGAHSALSDAKATLRVFEAMRETFPKLSELHRRRHVLHAQEGSRRSRRTGHGLRLLDSPQRLPREHEASSSG
jgi:DNA polymerase III subunit epsilon